VRVVLLAAGTDAILAGPDELRHLISDAEWTRAAGLRREQDRNDFLAAHALLRTAAGRLIERAPQGLTVHQQCPTCGGPHGRPRLAQDARVQLSLSHTRGYVAAAASFVPVGVDVERVPCGPLDPATAALALSPSEFDAVTVGPHPGWAFVRQWVRKEALVKVGACTLDGLRGVELPVDELRMDGLPAEELRRPTLTWRSWELSDWTVPADAGGPEILGCVAVAADSRAQYWS
jgi:4'-phosphopantetheinyl transferase